MKQIVQSSDRFLFHVIRQGSKVPGKARWCAYLNRDRWDDWGSYCTQFYLTFVDKEGQQHEIGTLKIGEFGLKADSISKPGVRQPQIKEEFENLESSFFSLGQEESYYERLVQLGDSIREIILKGLRDVAFDDSLWLRARHEDVMESSLLRSVTATTVEGQFRRMARGGAKLTPYRFSYEPPKRMGDGQPPFTLDFKVDPDSRIPTNVHVLIGRNGVGKTHLLTLMTKSLVAVDATARQSGSFRWHKRIEEEDKFSNLVTVSFSAFDDVELLPEGKTKEGGINYSYIGLRRRTEELKSPARPKSIPMLSTEFVNSLRECRSSIRRRRWHAAIKVLESDPIFRAAELTKLIQPASTDEEQRQESSAVFEKLSSGHKIVLLTMTRLVETVEEKTLVLVDEPEAHLHPPLLSAYIRALSGLLTDRNGVAIVATHSPVVLQEVPRSCVWILSRSLTESKAERPPVETFGENVGVLTRESFQLELAEAGFHKLLEQAVKQNETYQAAVDAFDGELGAEARAVLRGLFLEKNAEQSD